MDFQILIEVFESAKDCDHAFDTNIASIIHLSFDLI